MALARCLACQLEVWVRCAAESLKPGLQGATRWKRRSALTCCRREWRLVWVVILHSLTRWQLWPAAKAACDVFAAATCCGGMNYLEMRWLLYHSVMPWASEPKLPAGCGARQSLTGDMQLAGLCNLKQV